MPGTSSSTNLFAVVTATSVQHMPMLPLGLATHKARPLQHVPKQSFNEQANAI
jgi:hypothetical protein